MTDALLSLVLIGFVLFVLPLGFLHAAKKLDRHRRVGHWADRHLW